MGFQSILVGIGIAILLLIPLAIKWQIRFRQSFTGAVLIGLVAGLITNTVSVSFGGLGIMEQVSLEAFIVIGLAMSSAAYMFYRDPERNALEQDGIIVSPADGSVIYIKEIDQGNVPLSVKKGRSFKLEELTQTDLVQNGGYLIGIGMNLLNVHVNRAPVTSRVEMIKHVKGDFLSLKRPEAVLTNERFTTVFDEGEFKVAVVQIASRLVRRIETYLVENQIVRRGQRMGMIKFGSQVDLVIPKLKNARIRVRPGDEVIAGVSVLVEYESNLKYESDLSEEDVADLQVI
ncbi:MAG TPA: phosphatidylserine decarboxylase [Anaerolineae bacterium]|nr:phosphatidylserine decarboxylase [Anaerolineae bacterium]